MVVTQSKLTLTLEPDALSHEQLHPLTCVIWHVVLQEKQDSVRRERPIWKTLNLSKYYYYYIFYPAFSYAIFIRKIGTTLARMKNLSLSSARAVVSTGSD